MPLWVSIRAIPTDDGEACAVFNPAAWWHPSDFMRDKRFRVVEPNYYLAVACLQVDEMRELQAKYRPYAQDVEHWKTESDRLDGLLAGPERYWHVAIYEWESGLD